ncbi:Lysophospholipase 1 [Candida viswanathii]|uniref:Lysophospholipase n=1 Tax=Candida viswanathii TaxID=5486 RepID=A0A367XWB6_9ASCO|nr:Lysophospholipase 1 [Candida viswanathii]
MNFKALVIFIIINFSCALSPTNGYAPGTVSCPGTQLTRSGSEGINSKEQAYIEARYTVAKQALSDFLNGANMKDFDVDSFLSSSNPTIGLAVSGGGYRSMLTGAGQLSALDSRIQSDSPVLAGILQASNYVAGLSGDAWLVGSLASNDFISVDEILSEGNLWDISHSIISYYGLPHPIKQVEEWTDIALQVRSKSGAGFNVSMTDIYGRLLSYPLLTTSLQNEGDAYLWSDVASSSEFQNHQMPYPILVSDGREPGSKVVNINSTVIELTPYEFGSWDPSLNNFVETKYLGTNIENGYPTDNCLSVSGSEIPSILKDLLNDILVNPLYQSNVDIAAFNPNPFYKTQDADTKISQSPTLYLADGGEDGQNIPLAPLVHRKVSVIFAFDNSKDTSTTWPDGTSLIKTYERQFSEQGAGFAFPYVPDQYTFRNLNLTSHIYDVPLVIYNANRPFSYWSNTSTFKLKYSEEEKQAMIANGYEVASRKNGTLDDEWAACVGCAIIRREQERQGIEQSEQCKRCFENYCWDGTIYTGEPLGDNFSDDGLTYSADEYNQDSVAGFGDGGTLIFKKK